VREAQPIKVQLYCRLEVVVYDPEAVTNLAAQQLREAKIDWSEEEDDVETAVGELKADVVQSLAGVADPHRMLNGVSGVESRDGRMWAELGDAHQRFQPGFTDPDQTFHALISIVGNREQVGRRGGCGPDRGEPNGDGVTRRRRPRRAALPPPRRTRRRMRRLAHLTARLTSPTGHRW
jgi:hypothetical protein